MPELRHPSRRAAPLAADVRLWTRPRWWNSAEFPDRPGPTEHLPVAMDIPDFALLGQEFREGLHDCERLLARGTLTAYPLTQQSPPPRDYAPVAFTRALSRKLGVTSLEEFDRSLALIDAGIAKVTERFNHDAIRALKWEQQLQKSRQETKRRRRENLAEIEERQRREGASTHWATAITSRCWPGPHVSTLAVTLARGFWPPDGQPFAMDRHGWASAAGLDGVWLVSEALSELEDAGFLLRPFGGRRSAFFPVTPVDD